jgi:murein DD-endopeptidase MepM/ murein hydrolase activator NlpD
VRRNHYIRRAPVARIGSKARAATLVVAAAGLIGAGVYFCLAGVLSSGFPFSCNIPLSPLASEGASDGISDESSPDKADQGANGSQEIADLTGQGDTLLSLLNANFPDDDSAGQVATSLVSVIRPAIDNGFSQHTVLKSGTRYSLTVDAQGRFLKMTIELDPANVFHAVREADDIRSWKEEVVLDFKAETVKIPMRGSFIESVLSVGEYMELALKLTNVFRWDIDFQSESMRGDLCKVLFERRYADDRPSGYGRILCAVYEGRKTGRKVAIFFGNNYYDENGVELKKNFLRSPLSVIRVTSRYGKRFHPILRVWRKHEGVDYGAAVGTPVWSVASGVVTYAGWKNGYGRYVCIKHENGYESRYGHLHRYFVKKGDRVKQRQRIGLVGQSGMATGPHLDFQLLKNNTHKDPLSVRMVHALRTVPSPLKNRFAFVVQQRLLCLEGIVLGRKPLDQESVRTY